MADLNPHLETIAPWVSAGVRQVVPMGDLKDVFAASFQKVAGAVAAAGGQLVGPAYGCYFGMPTDVIDVEIGFGIDRALEVPDLNVTEQPVTQAVVGTHVGPYDDLSQSYQELGTWFEEQDLALADLMWEFYDSPPETDPAQTVTRMVFPLREES